MRSIWRVRARSLTIFRTTAQSSKLGSETTSSRYSRHHGRSSIFSRVSRMVVQPSRLHVSRNGFPRNEVEMQTTVMGFRKVVGSEGDDRFQPLRHVLADDELGAVLVAGDEPVFAADPEVDL